ncbi:MAG: beta-N-acetylhexosaminidase [Alphaproteobacteria bacterium]
MIYPVIFGIEGTALNPHERDLFQNHPPAGYILFARNIESSAQLKMLVDSLVKLAPDQPPMILIDQEGGRVQRMRPPLFPDWQAAGEFASLYDQAPDSALNACYDSNYQMAKLLKEHGITVNCTPVLDIAVEGASDIVGDRAYGQDWQQILPLASCVMQAHLDAGITPVIKHIPGHGRALQDSHFDLPIIDASFDDLAAEDFEIFKQITQKFKNHHAFHAMSAHVLLTAIDADQPITLSKTGIETIIRGHIGYKGMLISDDICMKALSANLSASDIALKALEAGCDLVLHCNGDIQEMTAILTILSA